MTNRLFAEHGSDAFNAWMEENTQAIGAAVQTALGENLVALILGGGYARAEGGVQETPDGERPYNDLDFTILVKDKTSDIAEKLRPVSHQFEGILGIDVDFSRPLTVGDIKNWPPWLMWIDLLGGHRVIVGPEDVLLKNAPSALKKNPPHIEATRLLLNRGAGLLWSYRIARGLDESPDADFIRRNMHKCELAIGDSIIMRHQRHQVRYTGRDAILGELLEQDKEASVFASVKSYRAALDFRLRPSDGDTSQPNEEKLNEISQRWIQAFLYTESARTKKSFDSVESYLSWTGAREPALSSLAKLPINIIRNFKLKRFGTSYPRESLYRELPQLLARNDARWAMDSENFLNVWRRYN